LGALSGSCPAAAPGDYGASGEALPSSAALPLLSMPGDSCRWTAVETCAATPACGMRRVWVKMNEESHSSKHPGLLFPFKRRIA